MRNRTYTAEIEKHETVVLNVDLAARWFSGLSDEQQADFFIAVAAEAMQWPAQPQGDQWWRVGRHLRDCDCATEEARELVRDLADGLAREAA